MSRLFVEYEKEIGVPFAQVTPISRMTATSVGLAALEHEASSLSQTPDNSGPILIHWLDGKPPSRARVTGA